MKESTSGRKPKLTKQELIDNIYTAHSSGVIDLQNCELTSNEVRQKVFDGSCDHKRVRDAFHEAQAVMSKLSVGQYSISAIQSKIGNTGMEKLMSVIFNEINMFVDVVSDATKNSISLLQDESLCLKQQVSVLEKEKSAFKEENEILKKDCLALEKEVIDMKEQLDKKQAPAPIIWTPDGSI